MSRWIKQYEEHPFQSIWNEIVGLEKELKVDDSTIVTSVEEIARFKKVIIFVNELLNSSDPELIPETTWDNFYEQSNACLQQIKSYQNNRNINHIVHANAYLDNLLSYIKPYQVVTHKVAQSTQKSFRAYTKTIKDSLTSFHEKSNKILFEMRIIKDNAITNENEIDVISTRIKALETQYFEDNNSELSLSSKINNFKTELRDNSDNIEKYRIELLGGDTESNSISSEIKIALDGANKNSSLINDLFIKVKNEITEFSTYYIDVFGRENTIGERNGGLKREIIEIKKHLDEFKIEQEKVYKERNKEIENLLPGATNAGLATAYYELKTSFNDKINNYTKMFYGSIFFLILVAWISLTQEIGWFYIKFVDTPNISELFSNLLYKLPIILPVLWITLFASKRRSEFLRLEQEYAHKEALAKSYQSFKMQIEKLNQTKPVLMEKLLSSVIDAISKNASETLDKKHGEGSPLHEGVDGLINTMEKLQKILGSKN